MPWKENNNGEGPWGGQDNKPSNNDSKKKNYNFKNFLSRWVETFDRIHEESGSWETRKNYKSWTLREVA